MRLYWLDDICWEKQTVPALEEYVGHYPQKENEIMLSGSALTAMGIDKPREGMSIPVTYYTLASEEEDAAAENVQAAGDQSIQKEFILSGWYTDYTGNDRGYVSEAFFRGTGVKQTDLTQGSLKITLNNPLYSEKDIIRMQQAVGIRRLQIIEGDYDTISSFLKMSVVLAGLLLMIFASGWLFIYNTLYISITKDIRYYGQLKTIGMTSRQLKNVVYRQAFFNSCIGIPVGLLASAVVSRLVIPGILHMVNPSVPASQVTPVSVWIFLLAGGFALLTNFLSSRKPAKLAGEVPPVEAMKYVAGSAGKPKLRRASKPRRSGNLLFSMAKQNMFRDKKQAAVIFLSFIIALSVFVTVNVIIAGNEAARVLNESMDYDICFKNETTLDDDRRQLITDEDIENVRNISGVKEVRKVTSTVAVVPYQEEVYGEYLREIYKTRHQPGQL